MLPWLFPYGMGGIKQPQHHNKISTMMHKRHLLMYYDKHFQMYPHFPLIAFNHEQIKTGATGYKSLNGNLRLVLITGVSKSLRAP